MYALALQVHSVESDNISVIHLYLFILRQMENLIEIKISYSAIFSSGTSRFFFSSLESVVLNVGLAFCNKTLCVRCSDIMSLTNCAACSTFQDFLLTAQIMNGRIAIFHVITTFLHSFLPHLFRLKLCSSCCSDCIYWLQQLYSGSMTETLRTEYSFIYLVKLSLTAWFLMAALRFVTSHLRCSSVTYIIILSHKSVHSTGVWSPISTFALSSRNGATMSLLWNSESYPRIVTRWWELILTLRTRDKHDLICTRVVWCFWIINI